jgi:hypothetical protein
MAQFSSGVSNPVITNGNTQLNLWTLTDATAGLLAEITMFNWGGQDTSLIAYETQWGRVTSTPVTASAFTVSPTNPGTTNNFTCQTYTGTAATGVAGTYLFRQSWNSQGGGGTIVLPIRGGWRVVSGALGTSYSMIGCGCTVSSGTNASFGVQWEE